MKHLSNFLHYFFGIHKWVLIFETGENFYYECEICGKRTVEYSSSAGYQPVNKDWLTYRYSSFNNTPPSDNKRMKTKTLKTITDHELSTIANDWAKEVPYENTGIRTAFAAGYRYAESQQPTGRIAIRLC